jgi:hypothetical protein
MEMARIYSTYEKYIGGASKSEMETERDESTFRPKNYVQVATAQDSCPTTELGIVAYGSELSARDEFFFCESLHKKFTCKSKKQTRAV